MKPLWTDEGEDYAIPLTSLVDVVFLLLIFFLLATTFMREERDIKVRLPEAEKGTESGEPFTQIIINVRGDGTLVILGRIVSQQALSERLKEAVRANPYVPVVIRGDRVTPHGEVVKVLDLCRVCGVRSVGIATFEKRKDAGG